VSNTATSRQYARYAASTAARSATSGELDDTAGAVTRGAAADSDGGSASGGCWQPANTTNPTTATGSAVSRHQPPQGLSITTTSAIG
jgi:hypothetical protein